MTEEQWRKGNSLLDEIRTIRKLLDPKEHNSLRSCWLFEKLGGSHQFSFDHDLRERLKTGEEVIRNILQVRLNELETEFENL